MRVDFSKQQLRSDEEVQLVRLMHAAHAMAASVVVSVVLISAHSLTSQERQWAGASAERVHSAAPTHSHVQGDSVSASAIEPALNVIDGVTHHG